MTITVNCFVVKLVELHLEHMWNVNMLVCKMRSYDSEVVGFRNRRAGTRSEAGIKLATWEPAGVQGTTRDHWGTTGRCECPDRPTVV